MIDILLASYNGGKYISEQIESILNQTYTDWFLYIKDDCSTDDTVKIILKYEEKYKEKIKVILSNKPSGSAKDNFFSMLKYAKNKYIMTCDQDDVWLPNKIEVTFSKMQEAESLDKNIPILVHTDLKVVDENLHIISNSLLHMQNLDSNRDKLNNLLVQNIVTGCTVMVNRNLLNYIKTIPQHAIMHDWWMALIASSLGRIVFVENATVLYRQHINNHVGAKRVKSINYKLQMFSNMNQIKKSLRETYLQSGEFKLIISNYLNDDYLDIIRRYSYLINTNKLYKWIILFKYKIWKKGFIKIIAQIIFC